MGTPRSAFGRAVICLIAPPPRPPSQSGSTPRVAWAPLRRAVRRRTPARGLPRPGARPPPSGRRSSPPPPPAAPPPPPSLPPPPVLLQQAEVVPLQIVRFQVDGVD